MCVCVCLSYVDIFVHCCLYRCMLDILTSPEKPSPNFPFFKIWDWISATKHMKVIISHPVWFLWAKVCREPESRLFLRICRRKRNMDAVFGLTPLHCNYRLPIKLSSKQLSTEHIICVFFWKVVQGDNATNALL